MQKSAKEVSIHILENASKRAKLKKACVRTDKLGGKRERGHTYITNHT